MGVFAKNIFKMDSRVLEAEHVIDLRATSATPHLTEGQIG